MKKIILLSLVLAMTGCAYWPRAGVNGAFYSDSRVPNSVENPNDAPTKIGKACATGVLGLFGSGDTSIDTAKKMGGITKVSYIEEEFHQVFLGFYTRYCVIVSGT